MMPLSMLPALIAVLVMVGTSAALAQVRASTLDELSHELSPGDVVSLVQATGEPVSGRLVQVGDAVLEIRPDNRHAAGKLRVNVTIPLGAIRSLERPRDSSGDGLRTGAAVGAGVGTGMFIYAAAVDFNEIDEWAPMYLAMAAIYTGAGALAGWAIDAAHSKPHLRFNAPAAGGMEIRAAPLLARGKGMALVLSF